MAQNSFATIKKLINKFKKLKVFVVGDVMLDKYWYGTTDRISPEAPVPVLDITHKEVRVGGAANVALNCKMLGANVRLFSVVGHDDDGKLLIDMTEATGIDSMGVYRSAERKTTSKIRLLSRQQQIVRIDEEIKLSLSVSDEHKMIDLLLRAIQIDKPDVLIFEDYNKGVLTPLLIEKVISHCKAVGVMTAVDPKQDHFFAYVGVDLFKPNLRELFQAFSSQYVSLTDSVLLDMHQQLNEKLGHKVSLFTLSERGVYVADAKESHWLPAHVRSISDVSGAGDTVISVAAMCLAAKSGLKLAAALSNLAGGIVCEKPGVVAISREELSEGASLLSAL